MNQPTPDRSNVLGWLSGLTGRSTAEKGTAKLAAAVTALPELTDDQALVALLPSTETQLRGMASEAKDSILKLRSYSLTSLACLAFELDDRWRHLCGSADLARDLARSSFLRERLLAFAKSKGLDALKNTRAVVETWHKAGRVIVPSCPECNSVLIEVPAEREDADCGLGAVSAGLVCGNCQHDERTHHKPTSRGSDRPFFG